MNDISYLLNSLEDQFHLFAKARGKTVSIEPHSGSQRIIWQNIYDLRCIITLYVNPDEGFKIPTAETIIDIDYPFILENEIINKFIISLENTMPLFEWLSQQYIFMENFIPQEVDSKKTKYTKIINILKGDKHLSNDSICKVLYQLQKYPSSEGLQLALKYINSTDLSVRNALLWTLISLKKHITIPKIIIDDSLSILSKDENSNIRDIAMKHISIN